MISVYITTPSKREAEEIASHLLDKKLIACANIFPVTSMYEWNGKREHEQEFALICKAKDGVFNEISQEVKEMHSADVPCIVATKIDHVLPAYAAWVNE